MTPDNHCSTCNPAQNKSWLTRLIIITSMNSLDQRLYHYEYRRPRMNNPTYNSNSMFDSLNMFVGSSHPTPLMRSYGRYSLPKDDLTYNNQSEVLGQRPARIGGNYSTIIPSVETPRSRALLNDKEYLALRMIEERNQRMPRNSIDYNMASSRVSENAQNRQSSSSKPVFRGDSLTRELEEFQSSKK